MFFFGILNVTSSVKPYYTRKYFSAHFMWLHSCAAFYQNSWNCRTYFQQSDLSSVDFSTCELCCATVKRCEMMLMFC